MKKLLILLLVISSLDPFASFEASAQNIYLQPCLKVCVVLFADNSGSMDSAVTDIHRVARRMMFIPAETGQVEVALYSFDSTYRKWCAPTGDRSVLLKAVDEFCSTGVGGGTMPHHGLDAINVLLAERRERDSTERQVVLIHSDYYWSYENLAIDEVKKLLSAGVIVILSMPKAYDGVATRGYREIDEDNLRVVKELGCKDIRSNFNLFKVIMEAIRALFPCG